RFGAGQAHPQPPRRTADHRERAGAGGDIHRASAPIRAAAGWDSCFLKERGTRQRGAKPLAGVLCEGGSMDPATSVLLTDLYQLNMMQAYLDRGETKTAVFEFFVRKLPRDRGFLIAAGLERVLAFLAQLRFTPEELDWLGNTGRFGKNFLGYLA